MENLIKENKFATDIARKAGKLIKDNFGLNTSEEWKEDCTPVTKIDKEINRLAIRAVKEKFPGHGILAEEESYFPSKKNEYVWVCDPVDGTVPFSRGFPLSVFVLALVKDGQPLLGVIYDPFLDRMFVAEKGKGSFLNQKRIRVSRTKILERAIMGFASRKEHKFNLFNAFRELKEKNVFLLSLGSAAYTGALVACGKLDALLSSQSSPYEAAALKIIIEEAGGKVTDIQGEEQRYDGEINGFLITNNLFHQKLTELIKGGKL